MTLKTDSKFVPLNNPQMVNSSPFPPAGENQTYQMHGLGNGEIKRVVSSQIDLNPSVNQN